MGDKRGDNMTVYVSRLDHRIVLQIRADGPDAIGDLTHFLKRGESAWGKTYEDWAKLPDGPVEIA
jgi:hypothetical protein